MVATLSQPLGWSHAAELLPCKNPLEPAHIARMCEVGRWGPRTFFGT